MDRTGHSAAEKEDGQINESMSEYPKEKELRGAAAEVEYEDLNQMRSLDTDYCQMIQGVATPCYINIDKDSEKNHRIEGRDEAAESTIQERSGYLQPRKPVNQEKSDYLEPHKPENQSNYTEIIDQPSDIRSNPSNPDECIYYDIKDIKLTFNQDDPNDNPARFHQDFRRSVNNRTKLYVVFGILLGFSVVIAIAVTLNHFKVTGKSRPTGIRTTVLSGTTVICKQCAVWFEWSMWDPCTRSCDGGQKIRTRACSVKDQCIGSSHDQRGCNLQSCPRPKVTLSDSLTTTSPPPMKRLLRPLIDLNLEKVNTDFPGKIYQLAALSDGGAVIVEYRRSSGKKFVWRISREGQTVRQIYNCTPCHPFDGLVLREPSVLILHRDGTIVKSDLGTGQVQHVYHVRHVSHMVQYSHPADNSHVDPDTLLLAEYSNNHIFTYSLSTGVQLFKIRKGLNGPQGVYKHTIGNDTLYVVCNYKAHYVNVYNSSWGLVRQIGGEGKGDGQLRYPNTAVPSPEGHVIICDSSNVRISLFSINGTFISHLYHVITPLSLYMSYPYLWVIYSHHGTNIYRLKLY